MTVSTSTESLSPDDFPAYFKNYIDLVADDDIVLLLETQIADFELLFRNIDQSTSQIIHAPYQWTICQVVGHLIDGEKIFGCRAHRIACQENLSLPGFDQDLFVKNTDYSDVGLEALVDEFVHVRKSNLLMFQRWSPQMWRQAGLCDGHRFSVTAIACILVGHVVHHLRIVEKRIGKSE